MRYLKVKLAITTTLIVIAAITISSTPQTRAQSEKQLTTDEKNLLDVAARRAGGGRLQLLNSTTVELPITGRRIKIGKVLNQDDGRVLNAAIDEQSKEIDFSVLKDAEQRAYRARYGKLEPRLHEKTENLRANQRADQRVKVAFWLNSAEDLDALDPRDGRMDMSTEEVETLLAQRAAQVKNVTSRSTEGLARALERAGHAVQRRSEGAPMVFATLPAGLVRQYAERADVQLIYLAEDNQYQDQMNVAGPSIKADALWSLGITGAGSNIAIVEDSRVDFNNSCLPNNLGTRVPNHPDVDDHATATAGMAAGTHNNFRGIASGAGIYSANSTTYVHDSEISAAIDAGAANAHVINNSWGLGCGNPGVLHLHARHADYIVRYIWDTVTASAGNNGLCTNLEYVTGVATGYNTIAVGNYDDRETVSALDNVMNPSSSFKDPVSTVGDREKPEVAAPGTAIRSMVMSPNGNCATADVGSGTSYSAPIVAGLAAQLMQVRPSLKVLPETTKALIMAGAIDNVEGSPRLSEKDGAGGVNALASYVSTVSDRHRWFVVTPSSFDSLGFMNINMGWVNAGQRVKVALVWDSNPSFDYSTDPLQADLDLNVIGPANVEWSSSWDNSYEVVDFVAGASGNHTIRVKNFRFNGTHEFVGVAWSL
ncbi:MAG TPA: S8 family serine peptidase [Pyrinomonadaceae bacterium]|nr:S8 family serine peptidase [Pyrinomonadaceae bacterium]